MTTKQISYRLFTQAILLLVLYAAAALITAVKFLGDDPLALSMPYHQVSAFSHVLLNLAVVTGLIGGGLSTSEDNQSSSANTLLLWTYRGWALLLVLAFIAGAFGLLEGRHMVELPPILDVLQAVLAASFLFQVIAADKQRSAPGIVWIVGIGVSILCTVISLIPASNVVSDNLLRGLAVGLNINVGYALAVVAIGFWLISETETHVHIVAGLIAVSGTLLAIASLNSINPDALSDILSTLGVILAPIAYLIFAAYSFGRASAWHRLSILLFMLGSVLGGLQALPSINQWTQGTQLTDLQLSLTLWAVVAMVLATISRASERQGLWHSAAFWLAAVGLVIGGVALASVGLVQTYMERILSIGYLETQAYLIPLYLFWVIGLLVAALGIAVYALRHVLRRA